MSSRKRKAGSSTKPVKLFKRRRATPSIATRQVVNVGRGPLPRKTIATLKYIDVFGTTGVGFDHVLRLNSIFDPDHTSAGHQPMGYDQFALFYGRYRVIGVTAIIRASAKTSNTLPFIMTVLPDNQTSTYTSFSQCAEQQLATTHTCSSGNGANGTITVRRYFDLKSITGVSEEEYKDDRFEGLFGANPTENIMLHIITSDYTGAAIAANDVQYLVTLYMKVEMFDTVPVVQS